MSLQRTATILTWINTEQARGKLQDLWRNIPLYRQRIKILRFSYNHFQVCMVSKPRKSHYQTHRVKKLMEQGFSEEVLIAQLPSKAAAFCTSRIFITLARTVSHCHYSQSNESSSHATRGRFSDAQGEQIQWPPHKVNMALDNKTCVLDFCLFY